MRNDRTDVSESAQAIVEYTILLSVCMVVVVSLLYFISAEYHQRLYDFWSEPLEKAAEVDVHFE